MTDYIQLLSVENSLHRLKAGSEQRLQFLLRVANLGYDKQVDVVWCGEDGVWHQLTAHYRYSQGDGQECWQAQLRLRGKAARLPRQLRFALRLRYKELEYWDNNDGLDYISYAGSGLSLAEGVNLQHLDFNHHLAADQQWLNIKIAVNPKFINAEKVVLHWSHDDWRHSKQTACRRHRPSKPGAAPIWTARLNVSDAFRLQYAVCCENRQQQYWDNNGGANYVASRAPLKVLILNLHCYQEAQQDRKFSLIAKAIDELGADVVCFQEVAEHWNHGHGDWPSNAANIINQRLKTPYHLYGDWSHLGFDRYREGVAILSRHPFQDCQSRYVSNSRDIYDIHARKVVMARIELPYLGPINVFSAHLSWWEDGFKQQFRDLSDWAQSLDGQTTLLCGDFNVVAGSEGYRQVVEGNQYEDQYLAANQRGLFEKIFCVEDPHWQHYPADDYRIDYIFMNKGSKLRVTSARVLFTEYDYGRVSDHCGYFMTFEPHC